MSGHNNDLVWVGRAPNVAAKLSGLCEPAYHSFITAAVYNKLQEAVKISPDGQPMWEQRSWNAVDGVNRIYRSSWWWKP